jgi:DNA topoisomerase-3
MAQEPQQADPRLWLQSMTPQAIRDGFDKLRSDAQMLGLADAARSRSEADWLVGINGTRAMTAFNSRDGGFFLTTVGRVQTPTLSIVVEREEKIRKHVSRDYWEVKATSRAQPASTRASGSTRSSRRTTTPRRAPTASGTRPRRRPSPGLPGEPATVTEEAKPSTQSQPGLYDLTTLQREANSRFGFSAKTTLSHRAGAVREAQGADLPPDRQRAPCPKTMSTWSRRRWR